MSNVGQPKFEVKLFYAKGIKAISEMPSSINEVHKKGLFETDTHCIVSNESSQDPISSP